MAERKLTYMAVDELVAAEHNPKGHDDATLDASVTRFGYVEPVVLDERTGRLVAGHGRVDSVKRARQAGGEPPEGITVVKGEWRIPVLRGWASRDDAEAQAYLLASNRITELGGWNERDLAVALESLEGQLDGVGWDLDGIDALLVRSGLAVERGIAFLDGLGEGGQDPERENHGENPEKGDWVQFSLTMPPEARETLLRRLQIAKKRTGADTMWQALVAVVREWSDEREPSAVP